MGGRPVSCWILVSISGPYICLLMRLFEEWLYTASQRAVFLLLLGLSGLPCDTAYLYYKVSSVRSPFTLFVAILEAAVQPVFPAVTPLFHSPNYRLIYRTSIVDMWYQRRKTRSLRFHGGTATLIDFTHSVSSDKWYDRREWEEWMSVRITASSLRQPLVNIYLKDALLLVSTLIYHVSLYAHWWAPLPSSEGLEN
jgi:hypothetical protein